MSARYILLDQKDNTATALEDLGEGETISLPGRPAAGTDSQEIQKSFSLRQAIPYAHKFAADFIAKGESILKYGEVIGLATADINPGEHVHIHNVVGNRARGGN